MSKRSEEAALKAYPVQMTPLNYQDLIEVFGGKTEVDVHSYPRALFREGYEQAEKDLALTWEDIKNLDLLLNKVDSENAKALNSGKAIPFDGDEGFYGEVLRRFNERRK